MAVTRKELDKLLLEEGYFSFTLCTLEEQEQFTKMKEENMPLPDGILTQDDGRYIRMEKSGLSDEELRLLITLQQKSKLDSIFRVLILFAFLFILVCVASFLR